MKKTFLIMIMALTLGINCMQTAQATSLGIDVDNLDEDTIIENYSNDSGIIIKDYAITATADESNNWKISETINCVFSDNQDYLTRIIPSEDQKVTAIIINDRDFETTREDGKTIITIDRDIQGNETDSDSRGLSETFNISYTIERNNTDDIIYNLIDDTWDCNILHTSFEINLPKTIENEVTFNSEKVNFTYFSEENAIKGQITDIINPEELIQLNTKASEYWNIKTITDKTPDATDNNQNSVLYIICACVALVIIVILVFAIFRFKKKRKNDDIPHVNLLLKNK
jgi:hypothetical protein